MFENNPPEYKVGTYCFGLKWIKDFVLKYNEEASVFFK